MAAIRNSIVLQDQMSPVFRSIIRTMNDTLKMMQKIDQQTNKSSHKKAYATIERDIARSNNELTKMQNNLARAATGAEKVAGATGRMSNAMQKVSSGGFNLVNFASALYIVNQIKDSLASIMASPDLARATQARLGLFNESQYTPEQLYGGVYQTAIGTRTGLEETGNLATRILISGAMTGEGSAQGAIDMTGIINKALVAGGGTSDENRRALLQLSQGLASGVLQGDELRAIREQTPYLAKVMAEGLAKTEPEKFSGIGIGDLKKLGADGELTAARLLNAFKAMEPEIDAAFAKMPKTFGQAMQQVTSVWDYFLYQMSIGDGALAKVNAKAWEFANFLASDKGATMLNDIANGLNVMANVAIWAIDQIVAGVQWLQENSDVLAGIMTGLATIAIISAGATALAWLQAAWPILLIAVIVGVLVYALLQAGVTMQQIVGGFVGGIGFVAVVLYDAVIWIITIVYWLLAIILDVCNIIITVAVLLVQALLQLMIWLGLGIYTVLQMVVTIVISVALAIFGVFQGLIIGLYAVFAGLGEAVLAIMWLIASAIDAVFGSSLADAVSGWMEGLGKSVLDVSATLNPDNTFDKIGDQWQTDMTNIGNTWKRDDMDLINGPMQDVITASKDMMLDPTMLDPWAMGNTKNPMDAWNAGNTWGDDMVTKIGEGLTGVPEMGAWDPNSVVMGGGSLDDVGSVGSIKSDVNISDEDIQMLKDVAARDFLLNLQTITPKQINNFGDVRETADMDAIMNRLTDMTEEALATSLVTS